MATNQKKGIVMLEKRRPRLFTANPHLAYHFTLALIKKEMPNQCVVYLESDGYYDFSYHRTYASYHLNLDSREWKEYFYVRSEIRRLHRQADFSDLENHHAIFILDRNSWNLDLLLKIKRAACKKKTIILTACDATNPKKIQFLSRLFQKPPHHLIRYQIDERLDWLFYENMATANNYCIDLKNHETIPLNQANISLFKTEWARSQVITRRGRIYRIITSLSNWLRNLLGQKNKKRNADS